MGVLVCICFILSSMLWGQVASASVAASFHSKFQMLACDSLRGTQQYPCGELLEAMRLHPVPFVSPTRSASIHCTHGGGALQYASSNSMQLTELAHPVLPVVLAVVLTFIVPT